MPAQVVFDKGWLQLPRHLMPEGALVDALNVIPTERGALTARLGHTFLSVVDQADVYFFHTAYNEAQALIRYQGAGTKLYRNFLTLLTGLSGARISAVTMRSATEQKSYTYFANGQEALRLKDDGITLTKWGLGAPAFIVSAIASGTANPGTLTGKYTWRQVYVRKPPVPVSYGRWVAATGTYTLGAIGPITLTTATAGDGVVVAGPRPFGEIVFAITGAASVGGVYDYAYWNGSFWAGFTPTVDGTPVFTTVGITRLSLPFDAGNWRPDGTAQYSIRIRGTTPPGTTAVVNTFRLFDTVWAAVSNPSPVPLPGMVLTLTGAAGSNSAIVTLTNPLIPGTIDYDPQITHSAIYRTRGDDPAYDSGAGLASLVYQFETDVPAEVTQFISTKDDDALGELMELDNDRPLAFTSITEHQNRLWGLVGNHLYFSKPGLPEAFPGSNYLEVSHLGETPRRIAQYDGLLYVWSFSRVWLVLGTDETSYALRQIQCPTGLGGWDTIAQGEKGIYFLGNDSGIWRLSGTSVALKITEDALYPFTHMSTAAGVLPLNQPFRDQCTALWARHRYYLSYPDTTAVFPNRMLFLAEATDTWWRDSRGFRALYYDKQGDTLYGTTTASTIYTLEQSTLDAGAPITVSVQTRDEDEGAPENDKDLVQLSVEAATNSMPLSVAAVRDYDAVAPYPLGTVTTVQRVQQRLPISAPGLVRGKALGYLLTGTAPLAVYRLLPTLIGYPPSRRAWQTLPFDGWVSGPKVVESILLDAEVLSGALFFQLSADHQVVESLSLSQQPRTLTQALHQPHQGTIFDAMMTATGDFRLYPTSQVVWRPIPPPIFNDNMLPNDLDTATQKLGIAYHLDIELLGDGEVITRFIVDGVEQHRIRHTIAGRTYTERHRLPATMTGRLFEIRRTSTVAYRLWDWDLEYTITMTTQALHVRCPETYGVAQTTPLLSQI